MSQLLHGPLNKTLHTQTLELLTKTMLHTDKVHMSLEEHHGKTTLFADYGHQRINVTQLIKNADLTHFSLSKQDSKAYINQGHSNYYSFNHHQLYNQMTHAEQLAIIDFTGSSYSMNNFLYENYSAAVGWYGDVESVFMKTMMISSGLNHMTPVNNEAQTYRGESDARHETIAERIEMVQNGDFTQESAFKSTSTDKWVANGFGGGHCLIEFENTNGKDISGLSHFQGEDEVLLNVEKLQWTSYSNENGKHVFKANIVYPLVPEDEVMTEADIKQFNDLRVFAENHGVKTGFITPYNDQLTQNKQDGADSALINEAMDKLSLNDVLETDTLSFKALETIDSPSANMSDIEAVDDPEPFEAVPMTIGFEWMDTFEAI